MVEPKPNWTAQALKFEMAVNQLLKRIGELRGNFAFKYDKNQIMEAERVNTHLVRSSDKKKSCPDAEAYSNRKILVVDSKNHSNSKIPVKDIEKLLGDSEVRHGRTGILVLQEDGCLADDAYHLCVKEKVVIVRLEEGSESTKMIAGVDKLNERNFNKKYLTVSNMHLLEKALTKQFCDIDVPEVLFTKEGYIDKRCKAYKENMTTEQANRYGIVFLSGTKKVDERCKAFKEFLNYKELKKENKRILNYKHRKATEQWKERSAARKAEKEKKALVDAKEAPKSSTSEYKVNEL